MEQNKHIEKLVQNYQIPASKTRKVVWAELNAKIDSAPQKTIVPFYKRKGLSVAASLVFVVVLFTFLSDSFFTTTKYLTENTQQTILLPDNSKVTLNPWSELKVNYSFISGKRKLKLAGEALFDIKPGNQFILAFSNGKVNVLGTVFSVSAYENSIPVVNCIEGSVKVKSAKKEVLLKSNGSVSLIKKTKLEVVKIDSETVISELNGEFAWENKVLKEVFQVLENRYNYKITTNSTIDSRKFTGKLKIQELNATCEVLAFAMNLEYKINDKTKTIIFENVH